MFLALGIMKVKCFPSSPSRVWEITEKELYTLGFFCKFDTSYTSMTRIMYSLNWCKCLQDNDLHSRIDRKQFSARTIMTVMNVNTYAVL